MAEQLFEEFGQSFEILMIPARGGVFEVTVDDDLIYSKLATGRHAEYDEVAQPIRRVLGK
jgi:selT/selW/selH-like putative selenoprotein